MRDSNNFQLIEAILQNYGIQSTFIEPLGNVSKVYGHNGVFALKKIDARHGVDFIRYVQHLYQSGYNRIVPIYPTHDGRYAVQYGHELYYLMPWLSSEGKGDQLRLFRELARLHSLSAHDLKVNTEDRKEHYDKTVAELERESEFLTGFIEECERTIYMSPFQLMFCTYYNDIVRALDFSKKKLTQWYEATKDHKKARSVIIHGKVEEDHFLYDDKGYGYFINFENTTVGSPLHDLLPYSMKVLKGLPKYADELIECLYTYFKHFPFKEEEMYLFLSYLSDPDFIIKRAEKFVRQGRERNGMKAVQKMQQDYWTLKNIEYIVTKVEQIEIERKRKEAEAEAQNSQ